MSLPPVVPDTNALIYAIKHRIDIESLLKEMPEVGKIVIPNCVIDELYGLSSRLVEARAAAVLAQRFTIEVSSGSGDECILSFANNSRAIVLTNDSELIKRLKEAGLRVLSIRAGKRIGFV